MPGTLSTPATCTARRHTGLDALKARLTLLVIFHHTAITYGAIGGWFDREVLDDGSLSSRLLVMFCTVNQAFFMGLFFLIAGYFTPEAIRRKGVAAFWRDRLVRLGLPLLFFGCVLGPLTVAVAQLRHGKNVADVLLHQWQRAAFENGPLWFAQALLIFSLLAVAWFKLRGLTPRDGTPRPFPSSTTLLAAALVCGVTAFALRLVWPVGAQAWGLQLGYFASYVLLFMAGCMAAAHKWLEAIPLGTAKTWRRVTWVSLPALLLPLLLNLPGNAVGGWSLPALTYALWEPLVAWGLILWLLVRAHANTAPPGHIRQALARRAYAIYIIHPLVLVAVTIAWRNVEAPALVKFAVSGSLACALCFVLAGWLLRIPGLKRVV